MRTKDEEAIYDINFAVKDLNVRWNGEIDSEDFHMIFEPTHNKTDIDFKELGKKILERVLPLAIEYKLYSKTEGIKIVA